MAIGTDIVTSALKLIGAHSPINVAKPEAMTDGFKDLVEMLEEWKNEGIDFTALAITIPAKIGDEIGNPVWLTKTIKCGLAVRLGVIMRKPVPDEVVATASDGYAELYAQHGPSLEYEYPHRFPRGQGSSRGSRANAFFPKTTTNK